MGWNGIHPALSIEEGVGRAYVGRSQDQRRRERERGFLTVVVVQRGKIVKRGIVLKITNDFAAGLDVSLRSRCFHS